MNKTIIVLGITTALSVGLYAGGDTKNSMPAEASYVNLPMDNTDKNFYAAIGVSATQVNSETYEKETLAGLTAKAGYNISEYFALELRGSTGLSDGDFLGHGYSVGIYLKPQYAINEDLSVYGLLGYAQSEITLDKPTAIAKGTDEYTEQNGVSFGVGLDYKLSEDWSLFVDAVRYIDKDTTKPEGKYAIKVDAFTFGMAFHF